MKKLAKKLQPKRVAQPASDASVTQPANVSTPMGAASTTNTARFPQAENTTTRAFDLDGSTTATVSYEEILANDGLCVSTNVGTSMMPLLRQGRDLIAIQAFPQNDECDAQPRAQRYDAVLYKRGDRYILHRVLDVNKNGYTICGDHCVRREKHIPEDALLGLLVHVDRDGKPLPVDMHWKEHGNQKPPLRYRAYVHLWCDFFPARITLLTAKRYGRGALRRAKRVLKK